MKAQALVVAPADYPPALQVLGVHITVLAANSATRGYEITLQRGDEGIGPPPHSHPWDESFFVTAGGVEFSADGQNVMAGAGTLVHVPAGTVHAFRFASGGGTMLEMTGAGGSATRMFSHVSAQLPPGPPDVPKLVGILQAHGVALAN